MREVEQEKTWRLFLDNLDRYLRSLNNGIKRDSINPVVELVYGLN